MTLDRMSQNLERKTSPTDIRLPSQTMQLRQAFSASNHFFSLHAFIFPSYFCLLPCLRVRPPSMDIIESYSQHGAPVISAYTSSIVGLATFTEIGRFNT